MESTGGLDWGGLEVGVGHKGMEVGVGGLQLMFCCCTRAALSIGSWGTERVVKVQGQIPWSFGRHGLSLSQNGFFNSKTKD